jgi:hypothetical protein
MGHGARPVPTDDFSQNFAAAARVDDIASGAVVTDPAVEPGGMASEAPAGFVRRQVRRGLQSLFELLIDRLQPSASPQHNLGTGAAGHVDGKELVESVGDFAVRQAGVLVEIDDSGLGIGAELALGGAGSVTGLQGMPTAARLAALGTVAAMDAELPVERLSWEFRLKLFVAVGLDKAAATDRALFGEGGLQDFIRWLGRRRPMTVFAVLGATLATRLLGLLFGLVCGERGRLPLGGPLGGVETLLEFTHGLLELFDEPIALRHLLLELLVFSL